ncbi:MAG: hypothetical protein IPQ03_13470 [Bacteroidetes bacterium]|nr:hypothetical protein [Bacteroidota bacterium]MBL0258459.1 hypothetical protein [Bacteroidota bacterium]
MKTVRLLFLELIALLIFLVLLLGMLEWKYASYRTQADILMDEFQRKKSDSKILWLGNSHTIPLIAELDSIKAQPSSASFAYGGMDLFWSAVLLEKYMDQIPELQTVCVGIDEELLGYNQTYFKLEYINRSLFRYTDTLDENSATSRLLANSNFFRTNRDIAYLFNRRNQPSDLKPMLHGFFSPGDKVQLCRERAKENTITRFSSRLIPKNIQLLAEIIHAAKKTGKEIILFTPPKSTLYQSFRDKDAIHASTKALQELVQKEKVNYLNGIESFYPDSLFKDPDHLNLIGASVFLDSLNRFVQEKTGKPLFAR